jgi:hypothetical protein
VAQPVFLSKMSIEGHKRGTINHPGPAVPTGSGAYTNETVMMENADSEPPTSDPDYKKATKDKDKDDDLVKIVLRWPKGLKRQNARLELRHVGLEVDSKKTTDSEKFKANGDSKLNFYRADGTKITDPATDLVVANLGNPGSSYMAQILNTGELTLFIEGAAEFGSKGSKANNWQNLGGAMLKFEFSENGATTTRRLLVYRGGFLIYHQPADHPGAIGTLEFCDGKGRISHENNGKHRELENDRTDLGAKLAQWQARSGHMMDGSQLDGSLPPGSSQRPFYGHDYDVNEKQVGGKNPNGHLPPGWWSLGPLRTETDMLPHYSDWVDAEGVTRQGYYSRWDQDDSVPGSYRQNFKYDPRIAQDTAVGPPKSTCFKFDLAVIPPTTAYNRKFLQIHPDGERNGTAGCVGIQAVADCKEVRRILKNYHDLKLKCIRE